MQDDRVVGGSCHGRLPASRYWQRYQALAVAIDPCGEMNRRARAAARVAWAGQPTLRNCTIDIGIRQCADQGLRIRFWFPLSCSGARAEIPLPIASSIALRENL